MGVLQRRGASRCHTCSRVTLGHVQCVSHSAGTAWLWEHKQRHHWCNTNLTRLPRLCCNTRVFCAPDDPLTLVGTGHRNHPLGADPRVPTPHHWRLHSAGCASDPITRRIRARHHLACSCRGGLLRAKRTAALSPPLWPPAVPGAQALAVEGRWRQWRQERRLPCRRWGSS